VCGRVGVKKGIEGLVLERLEAAGAEEGWARPNSNVSPTGPIPGVRMVDGVRVATTYLWGFLPPNAPNKAFVRQYTSFNARAETVATSRLYSKPFKNQRCLIAVNAWFEWPKQLGSKTGTPVTLLPATGDLLVFAGLWGPWKDSVSRESHDTATVITVEPNDLIAELPHHRMPAILAPSEWSIWLDPTVSKEDLQGLLRTTPSEWLQAKAGGPTGFSID
jgi:putative SOS response-associated peptidase YedK